MTFPDKDRDVWRALALLLAGVASVRILGSVVAGLLALVNDPGDFEAGRVHAAGVLTSFGAAGDSIGGLLLVAAAASLWGAASRAGAGVIRPLLGATMLLVVLRVVGVLIIDAEAPFRHAVTEETLTVTFGLADLLLCLGGFEVLRRLPAVAGSEDSSDLEPVVFAVDRGNGEVFAFFSYAEAARTLSVYSIEDGEFDFFTDEGVAVDATVVDGRTRLAVTAVDRREDLLRALRTFAGSHGLDVDPTDEPSAYAIPISDWQWLELWPGWLRWIGRFVRRARAR